MFIRWDRGIPAGVGRGGGEGSPGSERLSWCAGAGRPHFIDTDFLVCQRAVDKESYLAGHVRLRIDSAIQIAAAEKIMRLVAA